MQKDTVLQRSEANEVLDIDARIRARERARVFHYIKMRVGSGTVSIEEIERELEVLEQVRVREGRVFHEWGE